MPECERQLGPDLLGGHLRDAEAGSADIAATWQRGSTLYTLIRGGQGSHLYAIRSSGTVEALARNASANRAEAAWRLLTCAQAPQEPLAQLALEDLVAAQLAERCALEELDALERARYEDGQAFVAFARASGLLSTTEAERLVEGAEPEPLRLDALERELACHEEELLDGWAADLGLSRLAARLTRQAPARPDRDGLEQRWGSPPAAPGDTDGPAHACSQQCVDLDWRLFRPHAHRSTSELHAQLAAASRSAMRAAERLAAVQQVDEQALRYEAIHEAGPASARLHARAQRLAEAVGAMNAAVQEQRSSRLDARRQQEHLAQARELARQAARPRWCWWLRLSSARAGRAACHDRARGHLEQAGRARERIERSAGRIRVSLAEARARAPWSADPQGDWERLLEELPRLRQDAVAADLLAVADRAGRLRREAQVWLSLSTWSWWWGHAVEHELAIRHHSGTGPAPAPALASVPVADAVLDLYRRIEFRPGDKS
ncbi:hypothetical protein [Kitasatospora aureofaciens]|uniref:hypothetical protein n=1 Tax=Kitasatospora aureofaciens TaxID=1894 RepID=UPI0005255A9E|nr:hypothetical protein [Kitasatospora aureofaciens]